MIPDGPIVTIQAGFFAQRADKDVRRVCTSKNIGVYRFLNLVNEERRTVDDHSAVQDNQFRIQQQDNIGDDQSQVVANFIQDINAQLIIGMSSLDNLERGYDLTTLHSVT